ncbi:hypothetical protein [Flexibacterium corallicola]|uniref:hypothetical protein n=1 Tax=Flexibacterium corallicola TaxID=3037259 RepID=UPI00286F95B9|nr:hypothetical protein [Pseudovibrio sp. M1P-2-3]
MISRRFVFSFLFGGAALAVGLYALLVLPAEREVRNLGIFIFKLLPFFCASFAIALFPVELFSRYKLTVPLTFLCFAAFFFVFVPKMFFDVAFNEAGNLYYMTLVFTPFLILAFSAVFRLGGGSGQNTLRIALGMLCLMLSGLEDLAFLTINPHETGSKYSPIPEVWTWASHIKVRIGHYPSKYEAYAFISVHIALALVIALHSFSWLRPVGRFIGMIDGSPQAPLTGNYVAS